MCLQDNTDQLQIIICCTGYQRVECFIRITGFSGYCLWIIIVVSLVKHQITLLKGSRLIYQIGCTDRILLCLGNRLEFFMIFKQFLCNKCHITCRRIMVLRIQPIRIFKIRIYCSQLFCAFIHLCNKAIIS